MYSTCCAIYLSRAAVYVLCILLAVPFIVSCCCLCAVYSTCCAIYWSRSAVYVLYIFFAVSFVGLVVLSICCVFSLLCHLLVSCCCLCAVYSTCCAIYWSRSAVYVLYIFFAVSFVGLVVLSICCVFSLLCHLLVS